MIDTLRFVTYMLFWPPTEASPIYIQKANRDDYYALKPNFSFLFPIITKMLEYLFHSIRSRAWRSSISFPLVGLVIHVIRASIKRMCTSVMQALNLLYHTQTLMHFLRVHVRITKPSLYGIVALTNLPYFLYGDEEYREHSRYQDTTNRLDIK